jgi:hypothetical protein
VTSLLDLWRAIDADARLVSGDHERLERPVRGVIRTRVGPPHLPSAVDGQILVADAALADDGVDRLLLAIAEAGLAPCGLLIGGVTRPAAIDAATDRLPVLSSALAPGTLAEAAGAYLDREPQHLSELGLSIRLAGAEAALADPQVGAPAGVVADQMRRGVAVAVEGRLRALVPRAAGRALAARFTAAFTHLLGAGTRAQEGGRRRTRDGLWLLERRIGPEAAAWLFDDVAFARVDEVALDALATTLRALLRRSVVESPLAVPPRRQPPSTGDQLRDTLLAVARANGRTAAAARALGVHRNTVLYRLRRARSELGIDPRRADDALRLLTEDERRRER